MKIELKNVKIMQSLSEETTCYSATVYVNGKKAFAASNRGCGGADDYHVFDEALFAAADAWAREQPSKTYCDMLITSDLEIVIGNLLDAHMLAQEVKRLTKKIAFINEGKIFTINQKYIPELLPKIMARHPKAVVLNALPIDEAVAALRLAA
jgi:hypothetical protein